MNRSRFTRPVVGVLAALAVLSSALVGGHPASAAADSRESVLVSGTGEVFGEPDVLAAYFAVEAVASTVGDALDRADAAGVRMRDALVRAGVARADLQTSSAGIGSRLNEDGKITGYVVNQGLTAKIRDLPRAGALMSAAIAAGGDAARLNGVSFAIENSAALLADARRKAFADARGKAELYAREAGRSLGRVVQVTETTTGDGPWGDRNGMAAADSKMVIEPGRHRLAVTVQVEWALQRVAAK